MIATWARNLAAIDECCQMAAATLVSLDTPHGRTAAQAIADKLREAKENGAPVIALVGQYNAGKSTLIKALTSVDVAISADIETDRATPFRWKGLVLVDTPGVKAGRPEHDEETERWLAKSDLVMFVITNELFDDVVGTYFRKLAFEQGRAELMMLVINKIGRESSGPDAITHMRPSLARVVGPRTLEDFRCVTIDARSYLDAETEPEPNDQRQLRDRSRLAVLGAALEAFGQEKRLMARALSPLSVAIHGLEQARDELAVGEDVDRKDYLELLRRRGLLLRNTRARVEFGAVATIGKHASEIHRHAQELLRLLTPEDLTEPPSKEELENALQRAKAAMEVHAEKLSKELQASFAKELARANEELRALSDGPLARSLADRLLQFKAPSINGGLAAPVGAAKTDEKLRKLIKLGLQDIGKAFKNAEKSEVMNVAKFFGVKFKPWGGGKALGRVQGLGKIMGAAGPILDVVFHVLDERRRDNAAKDLAQSRRTVREGFAEAAEEFRVASQSSLETVLNDVFNPLLVEVEYERAELRAETEGRENKSATLAERLQRCRDVWAHAVRLGGVAEG
jgi:hypothetical protein